MTKLNLDDIEAKARASKALSPDWEVDEPIETSCGWVACGPERCPDGDGSGYARAAADSEHIAASSPDVVLALAARVRELEDALRLVVDGEPEGMAIAEQALARGAK